jgi:hypothetical protein
VFLACLYFLRTIDNLIKNIPMKTTEKLLITATVDEIKEAFADVFSEAIHKHLSLLSKPKEDSFLSRSETAKLLDISIVTLHTWTQLGKLHAHKVEGSSKVYYSEKEVRNLVPSSKRSIHHEP